MNASRHFQLALTFLLSAHCALASASNSLGARIARVEQGLLPQFGITSQTMSRSLSSRQAEMDVPGVSIAVIDGGVIAWARAYGVTERKGAKPVTPASAFRSTVEHVKLPTLIGSSLSSFRPATDPIHSLTPALAPPNAVSGWQTATRCFPLPESQTYRFWSTPSDLARQALDPALAGSSALLNNAHQRGMLIDRTDDLEDAGVGVDALGFTTLMVYSTKTRQGAVVMTNASHGAQLSREIIRSIAAEYGWSSYRMTERHVVAIDRTLIERYFGRYGDGALIYTVFENDGKLMIRHGPHAKQVQELLPSSPTTFFIEKDRATVSFGVDPTGTPDLRIHASGQVQTFVRELSNGGI